MTNDSANAASGTDIDAADAPQVSAPSKYRPLRIWPAVVLLGLMLLSRYASRIVEDGPAILVMVSGLGPMLCGVIILLWWLSISRATVRERLAGFVGVMLAAALTFAVSDRTMYGPAFLVLTIPMGTAVFGLGAVVCSRMLRFRRTTIALLLAVVGFGFSTLLRSDGVWGNFTLGLHWRWTPTPDEVMTAARGDQPTVGLANFDPADVDHWLANPEWPGFRGPERTGRPRLGIFRRCGQAAFHTGTTTEPRSNNLLRSRYRARSLDARDRIAFRRSAGWPRSKSHPDSCRRGLVRHGSQRSSAAA